MPTPSSPPCCAAVPRRQAWPRALAACALLLAGALFCTGVARAQSPAASEPAAARADSATRLLLRSDDLGMSHAANQANRRLLASGLPVSASVMFATPWHQEAVRMLKGRPEVAVGVHLTLNSEWEDYRWGPVAGASAVPHLVDSTGYFYQTNAALWEADPPPAEVEAELRAQIERALASGLQIDYLDAHMGAALMKPEWRAVTERLAAEYGLPLSGSFGEEAGAKPFSAAPARMTDSLAAATRALEPGLHLLVTHVGLTTPEMNALRLPADTAATDTTTAGGAGRIARRRHAQLRALTSPAFRRALQEEGVRLLTYRELIEEKKAAAGEKEENEESAPQRP